MRNVFLFICIIFILGCKKDKLKDDKAVFVGKWKWVYTKQSSVTNCGDTPVITILTPSSTGDNYSLEFLKKGCVSLQANDDKPTKYRTVFKGWNENSYLSNYYSYTIWLNNKEEDILYGNISTDTLIVLNYTFPFDAINCEGYVSYFVREQ